MIETPKRFVGLHAHSAGSIGDAIGLPQEHIDFAIGNGMDGLCLTDHGNMNTMSHQQIKAEELKKKGIKFKAIPGIEAYYVDSLKEWENLYREAKANGSLAPKRKSKKSEIELVGNEQVDAEELIEDIKEEKLVTDDESSGTVIEDESESKNNKYKDPIKQRNHLVILPKNSDGLKSLFKMCSESYIDGFYKYPRVDLDMIRKHAKGNLVATSACIAGNLAKIVFDNTTNIDVISNENFELIQKLLKEKIDIFMEAFGGKENFYPEIQMNKLVPQHLVNMHLIEMSKRHNYPLVVTCDSHYSNPKHWKEREIYKAMAWASKTKGTVELDSLPKTIDELKCELYPKNAEQVWETYKKVSEGYSFYDDQIVKDAIERTYDIAHNLIGEIKADKTVKLPSLTKLMTETALETLQKKFEGQSLSEDDLAFKELVRAAVEGLKWRKKDNNQAYIDRLKTELEDIKYLQENSPIKFARYFLTYKKIIEVTSEELFVGNGRGCFLPNTRVKMSDQLYSPIQNIQIGESVIDAYGKKQEVIDILSYDCNEEIIQLEFENGKIISCTKDHKFLTKNRGWVAAEHLEEVDDVVPHVGEEAGDVVPHAHPELADGRQRLVDRQVRRRGRNTPHGGEGQRRAAGTSSLLGLPTR